MRQILMIIAFSFCSCVNKNNSNASCIVRTEMHLSAFGVESDDFPSIDVYIDFANDSNYCKKWFYGPAHKDSLYSINKTEIKRLFSLLKKSNLAKLLKEYTVPRTDQPTSKIIIYTTGQTFLINDYGLQGEDPLKEIYRIVYKF